ncbi:hypothetical protein [Collimonas silvisoli]|uniref:hypothetical protein n=1 Tax=Collimonas silvisoli TaxID=2825884 RepID=UPI001B8B90AC|nr:hypothetical protein [Collimonas silvisoli]
MKKFVTGWSTPFANEKNPTEVDATEFLNLSRSFEAKLGPSRGEVVTLWVQSNQERVKFSVNPVSLQEDAQTKLMNRAIDLGYEPVVTPTLNPLLR